MRYHEDFEKSKGSFTPTTSDPVTERVKKNTQDFSDINYRGIQRRVVEMERRRAIEHDQETITGTQPTNIISGLSRTDFIRKELNENITDGWRHLLM